MGTWPGDDPVGLIAEQQHAVGSADTAAAVGSGDVPVLATPRLLAWCEAATVAALAPAMPPGATSVGTRVALEHRQASPVGTVVTVRAEVVEAGGREVRFAVTAEQPGGAGPVTVAVGEVVRALVDRERFLARLA